MEMHLITFYIIGIATVFGASALSYVFAHRLQWISSKRVLYTLIGLSAYLFFASLIKYKTLHMYTDFSHWMSLLWSISERWVPGSLSHEFIIPGTLNYFSVHFVPLIYVFAIPFKFLPRPETLLILNVVIMLSAAIPLYKLARRMYGDKPFALLLVVLLLWYQTFQYITLYEFEMLRFSIPVLLWMLYFFEAQRILLYFLFLIIAILVREEVGLTVAMFGMYALIIRKRRFEGMSAFVLGLVGFFLITSMIMPSLRTVAYSYIAADEFTRFGNTPIEILIGVMSRPHIVWQAIFNPTKLANLFMLGLPLLFIPLGAPSTFVITAANIGIGLLSKSEIHTSYMLYYIAPSVPFIFYALLKAWPKITSRFSAFSVMNALLTAVLVSNIFFGPSPISLQFWFKNIRPAPFRTQDFHWSVYRVTDHHRKAEKFVSMIPDDAIVSTQEFLQPRLYKKRGAMKFPQIETKDGRYKADFVFVDRTNNGLKPESPAYMSEENINAVVKSREWELVAEQDGYELYRRTSHN